MNLSITIKIAIDLLEEIIILALLKFSSDPRLNLGI